MVRTEDEENLLHATQILRRGGIVSHATEGVWGLACDPDNELAIKHLLELKGRSEAKGLILIAASAGMFAPWLDSLTAKARRVVEQSWPGAVTWLVPDAFSPAHLKGDHDALAVRVPKSKQARRLSHCFGGPLVSTSANPAGRPAATSEHHVRGYFQDSLDYILPADSLDALSGRPSTIRDALTMKTLRE